MISQPPPTGNFFDDFEQIILRKEPGQDKAELEAIAELISGRYDEYWGKRTTPETVDVHARTPEQVNALKSCYTNSRAYREKLKGVAEIKQGIPTRRCPYCQLEAAHTWDHFLPKAIFPDFYIYAPNLVRVCGNCNSAKKPGHVYPARATINPYYDPIADVSYLSCDISWKNQLSAEYSIQPDKAATNYNAYVEGIVRGHFIKYSLAEKFRAEASRLIADFIVAMRAYRKAEMKTPSSRYISNYIEGKLENLKKNNEDINNWEVVFWKTLNKTPKIVEKVSKAIS